MPLPEMHAVKSSNLAKVGHHGESLYVQFHPSKKDPMGAVWRYWPVASSHLEALRGAPSPGGYFIANVKTASGVSAEKVS